MTSWERQPGEKMRWFSRFEMFRLMGPDRSLLGAYREYLARKGDIRHEKKTISLPTAWHRNSKKWRWRERAEAWDMEEHGKVLAAAAKESAAMLARHKQWGRTLQGVGGAKIAMIPKDAAGRLLPEEMSVSEARLCIKDGIIVERTASGLPAEMFEVMQLSDEDLAAKYRDLLAAIGHVPAGDGEEGVETPPDEEQPV